MPANGRFVEDVTIPDDTPIPGGLSFTKTWLVENNGDILWGADFQLVRFGGNFSPSIAARPLPHSRPGQKAKISIVMTAPTTVGTYFNLWRFRDNQCHLFGETFHVRINSISPFDAFEMGKSYWYVSDGKGLLIAFTSDNSLIQVQANAPHYLQEDPRWGAQHLNHNPFMATIQRSGCFLTCLAMTASALGHEVDPGTLNDLMAERGCFTDGDKLFSNALEKVYPHIMFEGRYDQKRGMLALIDTSLKVVPVRVDVGPGIANSKPDSHWVLVVGRNGEEDYWINDPDFYAAPISLLWRYGHRGRDRLSLAEVVRSAIFYRRR